MACSKVWGTLAVLRLLVVASAAAFGPPWSDGNERPAVTTALRSSPTNIINCHVHLMTGQALPPNWPGPILGWIGRHKMTRWMATRVVPPLDMFRDDDKLERYANFLRIGTMANQSATFEKLQSAYNTPTTKFVVLPMDLRSLDDEQSPVQGIYDQHQELAELVAQHEGTIIPFVHIDPRLKDDKHGADAVTFIRNLHQWGLSGTKFKGIKLYPPLGYHPDDVALEPIWEYANEHGLPVISHCMSKGGVSNVKTPFWNYFKHQREKKKLRSYTAPRSYVRVLRKYPNLRLCLAHFGGNTEWDKYTAKSTISNSDEDTSTWTTLDYFENEASFGNLDWVTQIVQMLRSGLFPNLYVDTSYTFLACHPFSGTPKYLPRLKELLESSDSNIQDRVLFGSDYYMSEQEKMKETEVVDEFEKYIGFDLFSRIAETNPGHFLYGPSS